MERIVFLTIILFSVTIVAQGWGKMPKFERLKLKSRIENLNLSVLHLPAVRGGAKKRRPVLFIHGATFPAALAFGYRMNNKSWMDVLASEGFDVYALDFLGYGESDRYPQMLCPPENNSPLGTAQEVTADVDRAINFILARTGQKKIDLIGHSWGATVCARYAESNAGKIEKLVLFAPFVEREEDGDEVTKPNVAYACRLPNERIEQFKSSTPDSRQSVLEEDVLKYWADEWLKSDCKFPKIDPKKVCYPSGWQLDLFETYSGAGNYDPAKITSSVLLIRGEWDESPSFADAEKLYKNLKNAQTKRYVVIDRSTHVAHLEKNRYALYAEVTSFLNEK